jgi:hypothetical protein
MSYHSLDPGSSILDAHIISSYAVVQGLPACSTSVPLEGFIDAHKNFLKYS